MQDHKSGFLDRKPTLVARLIMLGFFGLIFLVGLVVRLNTPRPVVKPPPAAPAVDAPHPPIPSAPPALNRMDLIQGATAATAAYASGKPLQERDPLVGRSFAIKIPFGCDGPQSTADRSQAYFAVDEKKGSLRLAANPADFTSLPLIQGLPDVAKIEAVEGFWIPRPWSSSEACPPNRDMSVPIAAAPPTPSPQVLGFAEIFEKGGSRILRRDGRPYESTQKTAGPPDPASRAYRLIVEGRIVGFPDGQAIHCWAASPNQRPICLYAVTYARVAFENRDTGKTIAEWRE